MKKKEHRLEHNKKIDYSYNSKRLNTKVMKLWQQNPKFEKKILIKINTKKMLVKLICSKQYFPFCKNLW